MGPEIVRGQHHRSSCLEQEQVGPLAKASHRGSGSIGQKPQGWGGGEHGPQCGVLLGAGETVNVKPSQHCEAQEAQVLRNRREAASISPRVTERCVVLCAPRVKDSVLMPGPGS